MAAAVFDKLGAALKGQGADLVKKVGAVYEWKVGNDTWTMDLKNGNGAVVKGSQGKADCTLTMAEAVFVDLMQGKTNAQQAFMQGKLKIGGNMAFAMKLGPILESVKGSVSKL